MSYCVMLSFFLSFILCFYIIKFFQKTNFFKDNLTGPQKFHNAPTPRAGGVSVFISVFISLIIVAILFKNIQYIYIIISSIPIFLSGVFEDFTNNIKPSVRLYFAVISAILGIFLLGTIINKTDIFILDYLLKFKFFAFLFTIVAVAGVANAINIIDGYNGLVAVTSIIIFFSLGYIAYKVNDFFIIDICAILIASILGFFIWNYPFGKIFLGDGGAYFIGFMIAEISLLLINNHPEVSPWCPFLLSIYPVFETIFSIYRKKFKRKMSPHQPDGLHFHMLIYKRITPCIFNIKRNEKLKRNYFTSPFLWFVCSLGIIPGILFWNNTNLLVIFSFTFCLFYISLYKSIVNFKIQKIFKKIDIILNIF